MRGTPGGNAKGNRDAEARLQKIMSVGKLTHDEAVQAAKEANEKYETQAWDAVLPIMRQQIIDTYKKKEGTIGFLFGENTLMAVMNQKLFVGMKYPG